MRSVLLVFLFVFIALPAQLLAETRYVTDELVVHLRRGESLEYKILKMLKTGNAVEVLENRGEYMRVRAEDGAEGFVLSQYLTTAPPKEQVIAALREELQRLKESCGDSEKVRASIAGDLQNAGQEVEGMRERLQTAEGELLACQEKYTMLVEQSRDVLDVVSERDQLLREKQELASQLETARQRGAEGFQSAMIRWFLAGAGVLLVGWLIGSVQRKQRLRF